MDIFKNSIEMSYFTSKSLFISSGFRQVTEHFWNLTLRLQSMTFLGTSTNETPAGFPTQKVIWRSSSCRLTSN